MGEIQNRKTWTKAEDDRLLELRRDGMSLVAISGILGRTHASVENRSTRISYTEDCQIPKKPKRISDPISNFWEKVEIVKNSDACWNWRSAVNPKRYASTRFDLGCGLKVHGSHRVAFVLSGGKLTADKPFVLHSCDNKWCCNPRHLSAGSHGQNCKEAYERGLKLPIDLRGSAHPLTRLTELDVLRIRLLAIEGTSRSEIRRIYGLGKSACDHLISGRTWKHVPSRDYEVRRAVAAAQGVTVIET